MATKNVMLDIESLALTPDALILSFGAVEFELLPDNPVIGPEYFSVPDMMDQIARGRHVDLKTQRWWMEQPVMASAHWRAPAPVTQMTPQVFCNTFTEWLGPDATVWANGVTFDIGVLEHFFAMYGFKVPWKYDAVRDARTVYKLFPETRKIDGDFAFVAHHPLSDCKVQIRRLWEHGLELK